MLATTGGPIDTIEGLRAAALARFGGREVTRALVAEAEQWRMVVAPDVPAEFVGEFVPHWEPMKVLHPSGRVTTLPPRWDEWGDRMVGITLVDTRS